MNKEEIKKILDLIGYFDYHNKNLNIKQDEIIQDIKEMLKKALEEN